MEKENWKHKGECIRLTYAQDEEVVTSGIRLITEEIIKVFAQ
jgi:valine--pyruvate aminotransferase